MSINLEATHSKFCWIGEHTDERPQYIKPLSAEEHSCCMYHNCSQSPTLRRLVGCHRQQWKGATLFVSDQGPCHPLHLSWEYSRL